MTIKEAIIKSPGFKTIDDCINTLIESMFDNIISIVTEWAEHACAKKETDLIEYQYKENTVDRMLFRDRVHPVDIVIINNFNSQTDNNIEKAKIIYGPSADEYTRSHHALALVAADKIYFRNGAYKPETEEGRKLLAHELTHIAQNKKKEDYRNISVEQKESEAELNEQNEEYQSDPVITKKISGKEYSLNKSVWKEIHHKALKKVESEIEQQSNFLDEESYLKLLLKYEEWLKKDALRWEI